MLVATLEDLQGSVEVVVFPKVFEQTGPSWATDAIVLVAGRVDRRDEATQILCEAVWSWDDAVRMGPVPFGTERDRLLGGRNGRGYSNGRREPVPVEATAPVAVAMEAPAMVAVGTVEPAEEPPAPLDAVPLQATPAGSSATVSVSIGEEVPTERLLGAIESVKGALIGRPGPLPVVLTISVAGATRQVRLPDRVAWDARLSDAVQRAAGVPVSVELQSTAEERLA